MERQKLVQAVKNDLIAEEFNKLEHNFESEERWDQLSKERKDTAVELRKLKPSDFEVIASLCAEDLKEDLRPKNFSYWTCYAHDSAVNFEQLLLANRIWKEVISADALYAKSYLKFSKKYNTLGESMEIDAVIKYAHQKWFEYRQGQENPAAHNVKILIDGEGISPSQACERVRKSWESHPSDCQLLIQRLLANHSGLLSPISEVIRPDSKASLRTFVENYCVPDFTCVGHNRDLIRTIALSYEKDHPAVCTLILQRLCEVHKHRSVLWDLSLHYIRIGKAGEVRDIWLPLDSNSATTCARVARELIRSKKNDLGAELFGAVLPFAPEEVIRFGYDCFLNSKFSQIVINVIKPLLPKLADQTVSIESFLALKLFTRHGNQNLARAHAVKLQEAGLITKEQVRSVFKLSPISSSGGNISNTRADNDTNRDMEIESYLLKKMPTLKRSAFFKGLEGQSDLVAGRKTTRSAISVLFRPRRNIDGSDYGPRRRKQ